jgi:hypothetical protein
MSKWWTQSDQDQKGAPCRRRGQRQAKIRIAQKMAMTIKETSHSAMVLTPAGTGCSGDTTIWKRPGHVAQLLKNYRQIARTLSPSFSGVVHVRFRHVWSGNAWARDLVKVTLQLPRKLGGMLLDAAPRTQRSARCLGVAAGRRHPSSRLASHQGGRRRGGQRHLPGPAADVHDGTRRSVFWRAAEPIPATRFRYRAGPVFAAPP